MKHQGIDLDKAFPQTPEDFHESIERAFRKGAKAMQFRKKLCTALTIAACFTLILTVAALAVGRLGAVRPPDVVSGGTGGHARAAATNESAAPTAAPETARADPMPTETSKLRGTPDTNEENASEAETAAPEEIETALITAASDSGEENASEAEIDAPEATETAFLDVSVYYTSHGQYFHRIFNCSGMANAQAHSVAEAIAAGKQHCPVCIVSEADRAIYILPVPTQEEALVYCTPNGQYAHRDPECAGMTGASIVTVAQARDMGKDPCPICLPELTAAYYATANGRYYHLDEHCSGMQGASPISFQGAEALGKTACPVCITAAEEAVAIQSSEVAEQASD